MATYRTPYEILGLPQGASLAEVKDAYRRLCMQHHPDLCAEQQKAAAENYFKEITAAYTKITRRSEFGASTSYGASQASPHSSTWARRASAASSGASMRYSNGVVGAVIATPLVMLGMWLESRSRWQATTPDGQLMKDYHPRPHGFFSPPHNPFLRDDLQPQMRSRFWKKFGHPKDFNGAPGSKRSKSTAAATAAATATATAAAAATAATAPPASAPA